MKAMSRLSVLVPCVWTSLILGASALGTHVEISPVPLWPADGDLAKLDASHSVFYSPATNEYVVALLEPASGERTVRLRVASHRAIDVSFRWQITETTNGYTYHYIVSNGPSARQQIHQWSVESADSTITSVAHNTWAGKVIVSPGRMLNGVEVAARPQAVKLQGRIQFTNLKGADIAAGQAASGFMIDSDLAPGFVWAHARGSSNKPDATVQDIAALPPQVAQELNMCLSEQWDSRAIQVIGPAIPKGVSVVEVELNYLLGIQHMLGHGSHRRESPALEQLVTLLKNASETEGGMVSTRDLGNIEKITSSEEHSIVNALKIALKSVNGLS